MRKITFEKYREVVKSNLYNFFRSTLEDTVFENLWSRQFQNSAVNRKIKSCTSYFFNLKRYCKCAPEKI